MKTIYIVTSGDYSDYGIDACFDSKELAQKFIDSFNKNNRWDEMRIEEYDLNPSEKYLRKGYRAFWIRMDRTGVVNQKEWSSSSYSFNDEDKISFTYDKHYMNVYCFAKDENHAIKIANEKRMQILATNTWGKL